MSQIPSPEPQPELRAEVATLPTLLKRSVGWDLADAAVRSALDAGQPTALVRAVAVANKLAEHDQHELVAARLAQLLIATRRQDVALLGAPEVFVRRTARGELRQVRRAVRLSVSAGDMYQIPKTVWLDPETGVEVNLDYYKRKHNDQWPQKTQVPADPHRATLEVQGYLKINAVAGCLVLDPDTVNVDGEQRPNPWIVRGAKPAGGGLGDIEEIIVARVVVGPLPDTGQPYAVRYILRYDPRSDLHAILGALAAERPGKGAEADAPRACYLDSDSSPQPGTAFVPLFGGVGYRCKLSDAGVVRAWNTFSGILANAQKKAITVTIRNAMRMHPALGAFARVAVDATGSAAVGVTGWVLDEKALREFMDLSAQAARGEVRDNIVSVEEEYDVTRDDPAVATPAAVDEPVAVRSAAEIDAEACNLLRAEIDGLLFTLPPSESDGSGYTPTILQDRATLERIRDHLQAKAANQ